MPPPSQFYNLKRDKLTPPIDGPKLGAFKYRRSPVTIVRLLSEPVVASRGQSSSGGHGHVFEVLIRNKRFALKVFNFWDLDLGREFILPFHNRKVDSLTMEYHSDPFFAECRAYGKIEEMQRLRQKRSRHISDAAVPCYGFMSLPATFENIFQTQYGITDWNRSAKDAARSLETRASFRTLVKKLMPKQNPLRNPRKMANDFFLLRKWGIIQHDVFERNYLDGLLVDFSLAWTWPHWVQYAARKDVVDGRLEEDCEDFDRMLLRAGLDVGFRVSRTKATYRKLRPLKNNPSRLAIQGSYMRYPSPLVALE